MRELQEISDILHKNKLDKIEIFDQQSLKQSKNKFSSFYKAIAEHQFQSDKEASAALYDAPSSDDRYRQLKSRFRRKLLNALFFLDINRIKGQAYQTAWYTCHRQMALVYILKSFGAQQAAVSEALQVQHAALKYKFAEIVVTSATLLREIYAGAADEKGFNAQKLLLTQYHPILEGERHSEEIVQTIRLAYKIETKLTKSLLAEISSWCDQLLRYSETLNSPLISLNAYEAWMLRFELEGRFQEAEDVGEQAEQFLKANPLWASADREMLFARGRLRAALHNKNFKKGRIVAEKAFKQLAPDDPQRLEIMELYLLLNVHSDSLLNAFAIFQEAIKHKAFPAASATQKAKWEIFSAYLHLLMELRPVSQQFVLSPKQKIFSVMEFVEAPIPFLPQKENQTILIAIAQIMFLFHFRNLSAASRQIEWLYKLLNTLARKEAFRRQAAFIKLLYQLHVNSYNPATIKKAEPLLRELRQRPFRYRGHINSLEVIPYEKLWEMVLGFFK